MLLNQLYEFFIWWTGVDREIFDSDELRRLRRPYVGLGALALLSTVLAVVGAYSFIWSSLRDPNSALIAALFSGLFMWAFDRAILGYISPYPEKTRIANVVKLIINVSFSTMLAIPLATDVLISGIVSDQITEIEQEIEENKKELVGYQRQLADAVILVETVQKERYNWDKTENSNYTRRQKHADDFFKQVNEDVNRSQNRINELNNQKERYETNTYAYASPDFSFPEKLNRVLSKGSNIGIGERITAFVTFFLSAIVGSAAVVARTILIGDDSYAMKWRRKEAMACKAESAAYKNEELEMLASEVPLLNDDFMDELDASVQRFEKEASEIIRTRQRRTLERLKKKHGRGARIKQPR